MGSGIAQVVATAGFETVLVDIDAAALNRGLSRIERGLARAVDRGRLTSDTAQTARDNISPSTDLENSVKGVDHLIETVIEDLPTKIEVLRRADASCPSHVVFASNTSQFAISKLGAASGRPDRLIGSHWFNPPPVMCLIEVVRGIETSDETLRVTLDLADRYGRRSIVCAKDTQGFITSRLIALLIVEAARIVDEGIATIEDVNTACVLAFNHAMGPLDTADLSGLDTVERVADNLANQLGERFLPPQNIRALVNAGHLGRKSGRGFSYYGTAQ